MNINVYKNIDGIGAYYVMKERDAAPPKWNYSLKKLASTVQTKVVLLIARNPKQITIDFAPFHDVEWTKENGMARCFPLSKEEQDEFWRHFIAE